MSFQKLPTYGVVNHFGIDHFHIEWPTQFNLKYNSIHIMQKGFSKWGKHDALKQGEKLSLTRGDQATLAMSKTGLE